MAVAKNDILFDKQLLLNQLRDLMNGSIRYVLLFSLVTTCNIGFAEPWFTGPLLAAAGHTLPRGHTNLEVYGLDIMSTGNYNESGHTVRSPLFRTRVANPILGHGFTDWMDAQFSLPYSISRTQGIHSSGLGDVAAGLGFQLLEQKKSTWKPDLRFTIQETIPTGRFDRLNPAALGTDSNGLGSYQTQFALNFQHLTELFKTHYLRTRLSLSRVYSSSVTIEGRSSYGGSISTRGTIAPGLENDAVLALEYTLTQNWVAVMEGYVSQGRSTRFNSNFGIGNLGSPEDNIGSGSYFEEALTPAIEYNFNSNIGLIGGVWFPVKGTNTSYYTTYVLALNAYW